jgi:hypothetical protein
MCNRTTNPGFGAVETDPFYEMFQTWGWKYLGDNAVVLRVEHGPPQTNQHPATYFTAATPRVGYWDVHHLLPARTDNTHGSWGAVMHTPRTWGDANAARVTAMLAESAYTPDTADAPAPGKVNGSSLTVDSASANYISNTSVEGVIRESDLDRVYFVPAMFPKGAENQHPMLLSQQLYIDFTKLNSGRGTQPVDVQPVDAFAHSADTGVTGFHFPEPTIYVAGSRNGNEQRVAAYAWTYRLDRSASKGLFSYADYKGVGSNLNYYKTVQNNRNQVERRYVLVFSSKFNQDEEEDQKTGQFPNFVPNDGKQVTPVHPYAGSSDPFTAVCETGISQSDWFAIGMDFNKDGEFLGYISRNCQASSQGGASGVVFAVLATLNDQCTEFAQVYDSTRLLGGSNKAWTNRVWRSAADGTEPEPNLAHPAYGAGFPRTTPGQPFGSLYLRTEDFPLPLTPASVQKFRKYSFAYNTVNGTEGEPFADGVPYSCSEANWLNFPIVSNFNVCRPDTPLTDTRGVIGVNTDELRGYDALFQLFAKVFVKVSQTNPTALPVPQFSRSANPRDDKSHGADRVGANLIVPQIYSLNPARCFDPDARGGCSVGEANNITVNERNATLANYDGTLPAADEDANLDGSVDPIIGIGSVAADLRFFAFADDNRMPIRRVKVRWGDLRVGEEIKDGLFKNHKPYCSKDETQTVTVGLCGTSDTALTGVTCVENLDCPAAAPTCFGAAGSTTNYPFARFGNAPRACTPDPFVFSNNYACTTGDLTNPTLIRSGVIKTVAQVNALPGQRDAYNRLKGTYGLADTAKICVFQPRVQVTDNWEFCNPSVAANCNDPNDSTAYTPYAGYIFIIPSAPQQ